MVFKVIFVRKNDFFKCSFLGSFNTRLGKFEVVDFALVEGRVCGVLEILKNFFTIFEDVKGVDIFIASRYFFCCG